MHIHLLFSFVGLWGCSDSKLSDSAEAEQCAFEEGERAPCILEGYMWQQASNDSFAVFVAVDAVDPQGYLDITIDDNNFYIYDSNDTLLVEDELYCEDVEEGEESLRCIYSFLAFQYPDVDTNNLDDYRATAIIRDWEGNASEETELIIGDSGPN